MRLILIGQLANMDDIQSLEANGFDGESEMKRNLVLAMLIIGTISQVVYVRGFGGGFGRLGNGPGGDGIGGTGELWANGINGAGELWGDGAYGAGLPQYESMPGGNAAYGGFFSGPPRLGLARGAAPIIHLLASKPGVLPRLM